MRAEARDMALRLIRRMKEYPNENHEGNLGFLEELLLEDKKTQENAGKNRAKPMKKKWKEYRTLKAKEKGK